MMHKEPLLPTFIRPMLAQRGQPFDSREYLFEVKWAGFAPWPSWITRAIG